MRLSPNAELIGQPIDERFQTPALLLDGKAFAANVARMQALTVASGRTLRPHGKSHKTPEIARRQTEAGAIGVCCATIHEVEAMAEAALEGILLTAPSVTDAAARRIAAARARVPSLMATVDSERGLRCLSAAADVGRPIDILIDIDVGLGRTGLTDPAEAVRLARLAGESKGLRYRGIQAYYGHLQHVPALTDRRAKIAEQWAVVRRVLGELENAGLAAEIVSGGGTGSHALDLQDSPFTELQPGSYVFMDRQYGSVELSAKGQPFEASLSVAARVVSVVQPDRVIADAGLKAMATDQGPPSVLRGAPAGAQCRFMGDEHTAIMLPGGDRPELGSLIEFEPPHCDPTVNLHEWIHVVEDGRLVDIWPIAGRGF